MSSSEIEDNFMPQDPEQMQCPCCWKDFIPHSAIIDGEMLWQEFTSKKCSACGCVFSIRDNEVEAYPVLDCDNPNTECSCEDHNDNVCTQWEQDQKNKVIAPHDPYTAKIQERLKKGVELARNNKAINLLVSQGHKEEAKILCHYLADDLWDCGTNIGRRELIDAMIAGLGWNTECVILKPGVIVGLVRDQLQELLRKSHRYEEALIVRNAPILIGIDIYTNKSGIAT